MPSFALPIGAVPADVVPTRLPATRLPEDSEPTIAIPARCSRRRCPRRTCPAHRVAAGLVDQDAVEGVAVVVVPATRADEVALDDVRDRLGERDDAVGLGLSEASSGMPAIVIPLRRLATMMFWAADVVAADDVARRRDVDAVLLVGDRLRRRRSGC